MLDHFPTIQQIASTLADTPLDIPLREKRTNGIGAFLWNPRGGGEFAMRFTEFEDLWILELADSSPKNYATSIAIKSLADAGILDWCEREAPADYVYRRSFNIRKGGV